MSWSEILLPVSLSVGFFVQTWLLARATLRPRDANRVTGVAALWLLAPLLLDAARALILWSLYDNPQAFGDIAVFAIVSFFFVFAFYGFINGSLLQTINEESVLFLLAACWYVAAGADTEWSLQNPALWTGIAASGLVLALYVAPRTRQRLAFPLRIALYGVFLGALLYLGAFQLQRIEVVIAMPEDAPLHSVAALFAAMMAIYLAFHAWFAVKYALLVFSCVRSEGRRLAGRFFIEKVRDRHMPISLVLALLATQAALYASDRVWNWLGDDLLLEFSAIVLPQIVNYWLASSRESTASASEN